jgi:arginase
MKDHTIVTPFFLDQNLPALKALVRDDWELNEPSLPNDTREKRMATIHQHLAVSIAEAIKRGERPISIQGDCVHAIGVLAGLQRSGMDPLLVWFDAHGDFNTMETTPSYFWGGMPLAMMNGLGDMQFMSAVNAQPMDRSRIILADGRDLDPGEKTNVKTSGIFHVKHINDLARIRLPNRPIWVHFDTDVINNNEMPAASYPTSGGPSSDEVRAVFRHLKNSGRVSAISMCTWTPSLDPDGRSRELCMSVFNELL